MQPNRRQKRRLTAGIDGWTHVQAGCRPSSPHHLLAALGPAETPPACDIDTLTPLFAHASRDWHNSSAAQEIARVFSEALLEYQYTPIDTLVCLGLGSVVDSRSRRCSMLQLAVLHSIIQLVQKTHPLHAVLAQDPVFNDLDRAFLQSLAITIVDHPHALSYITPTALIYAPHAERSFMMPALQGTAPAALVGNSFEQMLSGPISISLSADEHELACHFLSRYHSHPFPPYTPLFAAFNDVHIYWRKGEEKAGEDAGEEEAISAASTNAM